MRVLHLIKTLEGGIWAHLMVSELVKKGVDVHVCLPPGDGIYLQNWIDTKAKLHFLPTHLPVKKPWQFFSMRSAFRKLIDEVKPDLIHAHFVTNAFFMRMALREKFPGIKRVFQIPGPLHLEFWLLRKIDVLLATESDYWIPSGACIKKYYLNESIDPKKLFLSYYGIDAEGFKTERKGKLRKELGISDDDLLIGNISYFYAPKRLLGQTKGLKNHELIFDAIKLTDPKINWVFIGKQWGPNQSYFEKLKASMQSYKNVFFTGWKPSGEVKELWPEFDLVVHVPYTEVCGGTIEPLISAVPVVASAAGGIPELVKDNVTGKLVYQFDAKELMQEIMKALSDRGAMKAMAERGRVLAKHMFDYKRTSQEILEIYRHLIESSKKPEDFDSNAFLKSLPRQ